MENLLYHLEELKKQLLGLDVPRKFFYCHECMLKLDYSRSKVKFWEYLRKSRYLSGENARIDDERKSIQSEIDATYHGIEKLRMTKQSSSCSHQTSENSSSSERRKPFVISKAQII